MSATISGMDSNLFESSEEEIMVTESKKAGKRGKSTKADAAGFEESFARLESIVSEMEKGELPLEELLLRFQEGVGHVRSCQDFLKQAQLKVSEFVEQKDGQWVLKEQDQH